MKYYITADFHFSHHNILKYCNRPFQNAPEMNQAMLERYNKLIKSDDVVFIAGDFAFYDREIETLKKELNGNKIFIIGNHDKKSKIKSIINSVQVEYKGKMINIVHNPGLANPNFKYNFCGHVHNMFKFKKVHHTDKESYIVNVGVDVWDFQPVSFDKALSDLNKAIKLNEITA